MDAKTLFTRSPINPDIQYNPALRLPRCDGHFFWPPSQRPPYISCKKNLINTAIPQSVTTANYFGPLVAVLTENKVSTVLRTVFISNLTILVVVRWLTCIESSDNKGERMAGRSLPSSLCNIGRWRLLINFWFTTVGHPHQTWSSISRQSRDNLTTFEDVISLLKKTEWDSQNLFWFSCLF